MHTDQSTALRRIRFFSNKGVLGHNGGCVRNEQIDACEEAETLLFLVDQHLAARVSSQQVVDESNNDCIAICRHV
jgi:hypothetical protein